MNFFFLSSTGHFHPAISGQFEPAKPGHIKTAKGGLLNRRIHSLFLDQFKGNSEIYFEDTRPDIDDWIPDSEHYKEVLVNSLPIINFYEWCLEQLQAETEVITLNKFISLANLIHEREFYAEFTGDKFVADLSDSIITLPKVKIYASIPEST